MSKILLRNVWLILFLTACSSTSRNGSSKYNNNIHTSDEDPTTSSSSLIADTVNIDPGIFLTGKKPLPLLELPQSQDGETILSEGFYEAYFKSYCLQPGTPSPSSMDAYLQAPLRGYRKEIIETILRNSLKYPDLDQKNIQLLLWSVVSGSDYNKLSPAVRSTARQLLSPNQLFELKGGVMGIVKTLSVAFPETGLNASYNNMRHLFELGNNSYEVFERIAVLNQPSEIHHADYKRDQWYKQADGYYVRYFPESYKRVIVQVYVPEGTMDTERKRNGNYLLFDPVTMMAIPANSNAQRLGIGAPVVEIVRQVIQIQKESGKKKKQTVPVNNNPKGIVLN